MKSRPVDGLDIGLLACFQGGTGSNWSITAIAENLTLNPMSNPTTPTAADLLAEWKKQEHASNPFSSWAWDPEYQKQIAAELDQMCIDAGISIVDGLFMYSDIQANYHRGHSQTCFNISSGTIPAWEQQSLQEWLLIKGK